MELILTSKEDLQILINDTVKNAVKSLIPARTENVKNNLSFNEGIDFLEKIGYPISKSQAYNYTMEGSIPFSKFGKKIIFDRESLQAWAESKLKTNHSNEIAKAVAESIERKN